MTKNDYSKFVMLWQTYQTMYRPAASQTTLAVVFDCLIDFSLQDIASALRSYSLEATRAPVPADIVKLILSNSERDRGEKANGFMQKLNSNVNRALDYVSLDWRGVSAFKATYGSLVNFCNLTEFDETRLKVRFLENYQRSVQTGDIETDHLIPGIFHRNEHVKVRPLESYAEDKSIIEQIYAAQTFSLELSKEDPAYKQLAYVPNNIKLDAKTEAKVQTILDKYPQCSIEGLEYVLRTLWN